ncbi:MAG: glutaminyl-peptide cyclotransferase [Acidobacteria bacterium]|nr:glutaminyl-peptide cyclotransferase [Acidobacteriota bacterium]
MRTAVFVCCLMLSVLALPVSTQRTVVAKAIQSSTIPTYGYEVVNTYPHDTQAFTQGLFFFRNKMYESTGLNGRSSLRFVELKTGTIRKKIDVEPQYFAEGMTVIGNQIFQLTWLSEKGFVYERKTMKLIKEFSYTGEGWGLTFDGTSLILSDGTNAIRFLDPETFEVKRTIHVFANNTPGAPLRNLNELEYIEGEIFANIWLTDQIVRIDPETGKILGMIDLKNLLTPQERASSDVLNGIAYDTRKKRLFVTGKFWPKLFEIKLIPKE